ncbi:MAG: MinD/ParA family protein [Leptospiraceae bacterium]|nr:MinD/ParA family protein [Leptospiraceae bacterium]MDW7976517.1 MinD/ParA family protein [Leptospiraceae bacterium]
MIYTDQAAKLRTLQNGNINKNTNDHLKNPEDSMNEGNFTYQDVNEGYNKIISKVIAVTSGKGGVGKTTFSVNFSIMLAKLGKKVLLMDGDLGLANVNVLLGIVPEHNIYEVFRGKKKVKDIVIKTHYGIDFIAGANGIYQLANLSEEQREMFIKDLDELVGYDYLIIDTGAGIGQNVLSFLKSADEVIVITTPEPTAITDAYGMIKSIVVNKADKKIKLIVNEVESAIEAKKVADRLIEISAQFLKAEVENIGFIYKEEFVQKSIRIQRPLIIAYPNAKSSTCIYHITKRILNIEDHDENRSGISGFFSKFFQIFQDT